MVRRGFSAALALALCVAPSLSSAGSAKGKLSIDSWYLDTTVTVTGTGLEGQYRDKKRLCLTQLGGGTETCIPTDSEYLKKWNGTELSFTPPPDAPPRGSVTLYATEDVEICSEGACYFAPRESPTILGSYVAHPSVQNVLDLGSGSTAAPAPATGIVEGRTYEIRGALLGKGGSISFEKRTSGIRTHAEWVPLSQTDIVSWTPTKIVFKPSKTVDDVDGLRVNNQASNGATYPIGTVVLPPASSSSSVSSASTSSAAAASSSAASSEAPVVIPSPFPDVPSTHPYVVAIAWAKNAGIVTGYPDGTFRPNNVVNRAELMKILLQTEGYAVSPASGASFKDVNSKEWYAPYVAFAKGKKFVDGYPDGTFKPERQVIVVEALKMGYATLAIYPDVVDGPWYQRYLNHALQHDILFDAKMNIQAGMTRKDVVWMLWRMRQTQ